MPSRDRGTHPGGERFWLASGRTLGRAPVRRILQAPSPERLADTRAQAQRISRRVLESLPPRAPRRPVVPLTPPAAPRAAAPRSRSRWLGGRTVLVVEDHDDSREVLRMVLESCGATVQLARNGEEALGRVLEQRPDLVLCDLRMPGMDGFVFMERLRADPRLGRIRVVAVTALGSDEDIVRTWEAGFAGHVVKPIDLELITTLLERVFWANPRPG